MAALLSASNHVECHINEHDSQVREQERRCQFQQSLESVKRRSIDSFDLEFIPREGYFPPEQTKIVVAQLEVVTSKVSFDWSLKKP